MLRNRPTATTRLAEWPVLNEVLSLNAQESALSWTPRARRRWFLNEVLSLNAQE